MAGRLLNQSELAEMLDVTKVTITTWDKQHGMPVAHRGRRGQTNSYDIAAVFRWYASWQVSKRITESTERSGKIIDIKAEEARLKLHQADKAEVEAQIARKEVLLIEDVKDTLDEIAIAYGTQLDALGGRLANELAAINDPAEIRQALFAEGRRIRTSTADALEALVAGPAAEVGETGESSSTKDSGSVG